MDNSESSDQSSGEELTIGIELEALVQPSNGDPEEDSDVDAHSETGYEASSDAESLSPDSPGKYVLTHRRQGQPGLLPKSRSEEISSRPEYSLEGGHRELVICQLGCVTKIG